MRSSANNDIGESPSANGSQTKTRNRFVEWVLIDGDRLLLTLCGSMMILAFLLISYYGNVIAFTNANSITRMASGMIAGTFSLVTIVVSVNQLILSQEFSPAGQFRDRLSGVLTFRRDIEDVTNVPATPVAPTRMLSLLITAIQDKANEVSNSVANYTAEEYRNRVTEYVDDVVANSEEVNEILEKAEMTAFDALLATIEYDQGWQFYAARHLRNDTADLSDEAVTAFDELIEVLQLFSTAQAHFKTIYLQRELTRFSQLTIYSGVPAVVTAAFIILLYGDIGGMSIRITYLPYITSLLTTIVFVPLVLLAAFILRTATITRRTAEVGPMFPQKDFDESSFEVSYTDEK